MYTVRLKPFVDDLMSLWDGLPLHPDGSIIKECLLGISAGLPLLRKATQFLGHKANLCCSRCISVLRERHCQKVERVI